jgi:hypothetical protein
MIGLMGIALSGVEWTIKMNLSPPLTGETHQADIGTVVASARFQRLPS